MSRRTATFALIGFYIVCALAITGPGLALIGDGLIGGVPKLLAWNVLWVLLSFAALGVFYLATDGGRPDAPMTGPERQSRGDDER